jgi:hypothetical protein
LRAFRRWLHEIGDLEQDALPLLRIHVLPRLKGPPCGAHGSVDIALVRLGACSEKLSVRRTVCLELFPAAFDPFPIDEELVVLVDIPGHTYLLSI